MAAQLLNRTDMKHRNHLVQISRQRGETMLSAFAATRRTCEETLIIHWSYNFGCMWTRVSSLKPLVWTCHHLSILVAFLSFLILTVVFVLRQLGCWAVLASYGFGRPRRVPQHGRKSLGQSNSSMFQQLKTRELGRNRCCMMLHDLAWCCMMLHAVAWCCMMLHVCAYSLLMPCPVDFLIHSSLHGMTSCRRLRSIDHQE